MKLEQQFCSLSLSKKLKSLGVKQNSFFYWSNDGGSQHWYLAYCEKGVSPEAIKNNLVYSAFTAEELMNKLPMDALTINGEYGFYVIYPYLYNTQNQNGTLTEIKDKRFSNALAKVLIYLLENKFTIK